MEPTLIAVIVISLGLMLAHEFRKRFVSYRDTCQERIEIITELRSMLRENVTRMQELELNRYDNERLTKDVQCLRNRLAESSADFIRANNAKVAAEATLANLTKDLEQRDAHIASLREANSKAAVRITDLEAEIDDHNLPEKWQRSSATERVLQYEATQMERDPNKAPAFEFSDWEGMVSGV